MYQFVSIERMSVNVSGQQANGASFKPAFSPDSTKIAFESDAANLLPSGLNGERQIIIKDIASGQITLVSSNASGQAANADCLDMEFSPDGHKMVFESDATNLVAGVTNGKRHVYMKDLDTGVVTLISSNTAGAAGNQNSGDPMFSPDGTKVVFSSISSNFAAGDNNLSSGGRDIFIKDLATGVTSLVSSDANGNIGNGNGDDPSWSFDGKSVIFWSSASNLVPGGTNGVEQVYIKNIQTGAVRLVSVDNAGDQSNGYNNDPSFTPDNKMITYWSDASDILPGDTNAKSDIVLYNLATNKVSIGSANAQGVIGNGSSQDPLFTADGKYLTMKSTSSNFDPAANNDKYQIFVKDMTTGEMELLSTNNQGVQGNDSSDDPIFSDNGKYVAFESFATNFVSGDTNGKLDIYMARVTLVDSETPPIFGTPHVDRLNGTSGNDYMDALAGNDRVDGLAGNDTIIGGAGADVLTGGTGADLYTFANLTHSVETARDRIVDFSLAQDKIDLGGLGFTSLTTHTTTLAGELRLTYSAASDRTYVQSDQSTFEFFLDGNLRTTLTNSHFIFNEDIVGDGGNNTLIGTSAGEIIKGLAGNDTITGNGGADTIDGGAGKDVFTGNAGADIFTFKLLTESTETNLDRITDFVVDVDKIDLRGLGFDDLVSTSSTQAGELRLAYSAASDRTYIRSDQSTFEFYLNGDYRATLEDGDFIFT